MIISNLLTEGNISALASDCYKTADAYGSKTIYPLSRAASTKPMITTGQPKRNIKKCVLLDEGDDGLGCGYGECSDPYAAGDMILCDAQCCAVQVSGSRVNTQNGHC